MSIKAIQQLPKDQFLKNSTADVMAESQAALWIKFPEKFDSNGILRWYITVQEMFAQSLLLSESGQKMHECQYGGHRGTAGPSAGSS